MYQIYNVVLKNEKFLPKQYADLVMLLIFVLLNGNVFLSEKIQSLFLEETIHNTLLVKNELLQIPPVLLIIDKHMHKLNSVVFLSFKIQKNSNNSYLTGSISFRI